MTPELEERFQSLDNAQALALANYSGIYFLCQGATVVYVGRAKNIARRIAKHIGSKDFDTVMVMRVPEEQLASVEMHWIRRLRPQLNIHPSDHSKPGRRATGKITVALRFYQETKDLLEKAIIQTRSASLSEYVERAVLDRFKKDGIK